MNRRLNDLTIALTRATAIATALLLVTILTVTRSQAAFTASTSNTANAFSAGSVIVADDDSGSTMFSATGMVPGSPITACIRVTYSGSLVPAPVRLYGSTTGTLDTYLDTTIEIGTGGNFGDCAGFSSSSVLYTGTLEAFATSHSNWSNGIAAFTAAANPTVRTFRFTIGVQNNNNAQGLSSTATFVFETQA